MICPCHHHITRIPPSPLSSSLTVKHPVQFNSRNASSVVSFFPKRPFQHRHPLAVPLLARGRASRRRVAWVVALICALRRLNTRVLPLTVVSVVGVKGGARVLGLLVLGVGRWRRGRAVSILLLLVVIALVAALVVVVHLVVVLVVAPRLVVGSHPASAVDGRDATAAATTRGESERTMVSILR